MKWVVHCFHSDARLFNLSRYPNLVPSEAPCMSAFSLIALLLTLTALLAYLNYRLFVYRRRSASWGYRSCSRYC